MRILRLALMLVMLLPLTCFSGGSLRLERDNTIRLRGFNGEVDQVIAWYGSLWVRSASRKVGAPQTLEVFSPDGRHRRSFSLSEKRFQWFTFMAVGRRGLYCLDAVGRLLLLDEELTVHQDVVLRGDHPYPYYPRSLAVMANGSILVAGCFPTETFLDRGCLEIHRFGGEALWYEGSSLATGPVGRQRPLTQDKILAVAPNGDVWVFSETEPTGWYRRSGRKEWRSVDFGSYGFSPQGHTPPGEDFLETYNAAPRVTSIAFSNRLTLVGVFLGARGVSRLVAFDHKGVAVSTVLARGCLVGQRAQQLILARKDDDGWLLDFYSVEQES